MAWIPVCEAMLLMPGWKDSAGTLAEIAEAERLGSIPRFTSIDSLYRHFNRGK
jgi:hypothetical protein